MEQSYRDIEARIQFAQQQRSVALGSLLAAGWHRCRQLFASLQYRPASGKAPRDNTSSLIRYQYLP